MALASILVFPTVDSLRQAFPQVEPGLIGHDMAYPAMLTFLPAGLMGLMVAGLLSAYVSTISTHLNWGTSYLIHDLYRRFLRPEASEKHYVLMGRITTALLMLIAALVTYVLDTASNAFQLLLSIGAGTGLLYLLRWFWWRINAWSEISAMASSFIVALYFYIRNQQGAGIPAETVLLSTVALTTVVWLLVTFLSQPTTREQLLAFYRRVRPAGPGWESIRREADLAPSPDSLPHAFLGWICGCLFVYSALFGTGSLLYGRTGMALVFLAVGVASGLALLKLVPAMWGASDERQKA